jgi:hypothetical protein
MPDVWFKLFIGDDLTGTLAKIEVKGSVIEDVDDLKEVVQAKCPNNFKKL